METYQEYKKMSQDERGILRDVDAVCSYMDDETNQEEFDIIYMELCEYYNVDGPGQIPHKQ